MMVPGPAKPVKIWLWSKFKLRPTPPMAGMPDGPAVKSRARMRKSGWVMTRW